MKMGTFASRANSTAAFRPGAGVLPAVAQQHHAGQRRAALLVDQLLQGLAQPGLRAGRGEELPPRRPPWAGRLVGRSRFAGGAAAVPLSIRCPAPGCRAAASPATTMRSRSRLLLNW